MSFITLTHAAYFLSFKLQALSLQVKHAEAQTIECIKGFKDDGVDSIPIVID